MKKILFCSVFLLCSFFIGCNEKNDIEFAKEFFNKIAEGKSSAIDDIDWENFSGTGFDIGGKLSNISDKREKEDLKKTFINSFSDSFKKSGLKLNNISNWTIEDTIENKTIISAEIEPDIFLYFVVLKNKDEKKISSLLISNIDLKLPVEFCSLKKQEYSPFYFCNIFFPQSLIDRYIISKEKKDAELIKKKGYTKRTGLSFLLPSKNSYVTDTLPIKSFALFDTSGYLIKTVRNDILGKEKEEIHHKHSADEKISLKLIDEKKGFYEENDTYNKIYYYTMIDSLHYQIYKIHDRGDILIYKYNKSGSLSNTFKITDKGKYDGQVSLFYDSSGNVLRRILYLNNGILNDSLYSAKYDSSGKILENVRYYVPGTFDINFLLFYKCNYKYNKKGDLIEKNFNDICGISENLIYTYNSDNNISEISIAGIFQSLFDETRGEKVIFKFNNDGLLIETVNTGGDIVVTTDATKYTYK